MSMLEVRELTKHFPVKKGLLVERTVDHVRAVDGVSFDIADERLDQVPGPRADRARA
jgi:ABC-type oligopeptide transport system ATPase subunit